MEKGCIYCGAKGDLSKSDIIPDALTNAKIINPNVCRIEHNNNFSDMFEHEVIEKLALITNKLDIKSSKCKKYAIYQARVNVDGTEYSTKMSSETELFRGKKIMRSIDGKSLIGPIDEIRKIKKANETDISEVDVNQLVIEETVNLNFPVFFSLEMYRLVAKIAFEWYCLNNKVSNKIDAFDQIIKFITTGEDLGLVTIVSNEVMYEFIFNNMDYGSHTLLSYIAEDGSVNVVVSLFGIAIYNIRVLDNIINECPNNVLFQKVDLDAKRVKFGFDTLPNMEKAFYNCFREVNCNGITAMIPMRMNDTTLQYKILYINYYEMFQKDLQCVREPDEKTINLVRKYMEEVLQASALTIRGLKRFVKEHRNNFKECLRLNPNGTNKKSTFMFYILFLIGQSNGKVKSLQDLNNVLKEKFAGGTIVITDEVSSKLLYEMFLIEEHSEVIAEGSKVVEAWDFD